MVPARYRPLLFLLAMILPSIVIGILGWRLFDKEQQRIKYAGFLNKMVPAFTEELERIKSGELSAFSETNVRISVNQGKQLAIVYESDQQRDLVTRLQTDFPSLDLKPGIWEVYDTGKALLFLTLPQRDSGRQFLYAVRPEEIIKEVRLKLKGDALASEFAIERLPDECKSDPSKFSDSPITLLKNCEGLPLADVQFQNLQIVFRVGETSAQSALNWYRLASIALVILITLLAGLFIWRDTMQKVRTGEMQSQFMSNMSHELRTPLTGIQMFAEMLQERGSTNPEIQGKCLDVIVHETKRLTRLVNNVLNFSSSESAQRNYHPTLIPLDNVVRSAADAMRSMLSMQGFSLRVDICEGLPPTLIDRDALQQAIINLLSNAIKYAGSSRAIDLRLFYDSEYAQIEVVDYGIGIAATELNRIFERSYRVESKENRAISGAGLGLAIVAYIAKAHGGSVYVDSTPGKGSTFSIRIPVSRNVQP